MSRMTKMHYSNGMSASLHRNLLTNVWQQNLFTNVGGLSDVIRELSEAFTEISDVVRELSEAFRELSGAFQELSDDVQEFSEGFCETLRTTSDSPRAFVKTFSCQTFVNRFR